MLRFQLPFISFQLPFISIFGGLLAALPPFPLLEAALLPLLTKHQLHAYSDLAGVLRNLADLGVEGPTDLAEMTPDEVEGLGLRNIQKRRFQRMLDEERSGAVPDWLG
eukprot:CAMPEP_0113705278 /NCGR_PEP_ID=MMETSP0038_2-20120614/27040_1 /TAXON_ID=2898 /ORGANISM="Cryptomonas paramecium" /LENGTH=107 /DNA_ID=CAMNT_0000630261 /DNA_START=294 /DNA_END=617 /DNA_ORIENTATION=- /assembly_acc=CAM_ASM_000170